MWLRFLRKSVAFALVAGGALALFGTGLLTLLGFGTGGIVALSPAAWVQSTFYGAYTCGVFSTLTSIAATATAPAVGGILAAVASIVTGLWLWFGS